MCRPPIAQESSNSDARDPKPHRMALSDMARNGKDQPPEETTNTRSPSLGVRHFQMVTARAYGQWNKMLRGARPGKAFGSADG